MIALLAALLLTGADSLNTTPAPLSTNLLL